MKRHVTIRKKIFAGLCFTTLCLGVLAVISYSNLLRIEERIQVLGRFHEIERTIMEVRREGKSYLFYADDGSYRQTLAGVAVAKTMLLEARSHLLFAEPQAMADALEQRLDAYAQAIRQVHGLAPQDGALLLRKSDAHRISMALEEDILGLSAAVRERIGFISASLRAQLAAAALAVAVLLGLLWYFVRAHVLKPLGEMEETTRQIAQGHFQPVALRPARDEIRDLQAAFNSMVAELERRQEQLVQAQKLSSIGTLSAGVAHQLNNPLNNISLLAQMLRARLGDGHDPAVSKTLASMEDETLRARDIITGLLDFARKSPFSPRRAELRAIADSAIRLVAPQTPPRVRVVNDVAHDVWVHVDPARMAEAVLNIVINAVQALGEHAGEVRLSVTVEAGHAALSIQDTGPGIAETDLPHVFDPFFTRKDIGQGTGLGLAVSYGIIEECKGSVGVRSTPGQGARFVIRLPLADTAVASGENDHA